MNILKFLLLLITCYANIAKADVIDFGEYYLNTGDFWDVEYGHFQIKLTNAENQDLVKISKFNFPEHTSSQTIREKDMDLFRKVGIFMVYETGVKFNTYSECYEKKWTAYTEELVTLISYSSKNEITQRAVIEVESMLEKAERK